MQFVVTCRADDRTEVGKKKARQVNTRDRWAETYSFAEAGTKEEPLFCGVGIEK